MATSTSLFNFVLVLSFLLFILATPPSSEALHSSHTSSHARKSLNERRRALDERERRNTLPLNRRQGLLGDLGDTLGGVGDGLGGALGGVLDGLGLGKQLLPHESSRHNVQPRHLAKISPISDIYLLSSPHTLTLHPRIFRMQSMLFSSRFDSIGALNFCLYF